ncbi:MAG TPA: putative lipid II flippase FtsW [Kofleriaceae bacterium]|jgi:cell division protein FtsW|nr:putative lipid II flippase FtsW [Kofleriaceae bacterium]
MAVPRRTPSRWTTQPDGPPTAPELADRAPTDRAGRRRAPTHRADPQRAPTDRADRQRPPTDRGAGDRARPPRAATARPAHPTAPRLDWRAWLRRLPPPRAWLSGIRRLRAALIRRPAEVPVDATARTIDPTLPATAQIVAVQHPSAALPERPYDLVLLACVLGLLGIGTIEIYSATAADGLTRFHDDTHALERQVGFLVVGGLAMWLGARIDYRRLKQWTYPLLLGSLALLAATLAAPAINGARRWLPLGPLTLQPVELAKLALVTYLAYSLGRKADQVKTFTVGFVPHVLVCGMMMVALLKQPDLGSSVVLGATTLGMLFMAGARISYILLAVLAAAPIAYRMVVGTSWRLQRVLAYFNPEAYARGDGYQFMQARLAMGSGGLTGAGLGGGHQTLGYTPEAHSDFILAPIGEELGWLGVALVLVLFAILVWRGIRAALGARDVFGGYLAFGIALLFGVQALFNVGVVLGIVPNKGITLPLVSSGGSSLVITMFLIGLLLNVGRRPERRPREQPARELARRKRMRVRVVLG